MRTRKTIRFLSVLLVIVAFLYWDKGYAADAICFLLASLIAVAFSFVASPIKSIDVEYGILREPHRSQHGPQFGGLVMEQPQRTKSNLFQARVRQGSSTEPVES